MPELLDLSAVEARAALDTKSISATELTSAYIDAAEKTAELNNYVLLTPDHALEMAARADRRLAGVRGVFAVSYRRDSAGRVCTRGAGQRQ